jgi:protein-tyrosine phosphatase
MAMTQAVAGPARKLALSGCYNFRDLGGYRTTDGLRLKWRRLFRADGLTRLDAGDCAILAGFGLATVIDLRTADEVGQRGRFPEGYLEVEYHHLPLADVLPSEQDLARYAEPAFVTDRYLRLFAEGWSSISRAVRLMAAPGALPAVFHCSAGKDRTGVLAALVLGFLGVPDDSIVEDYALSGAAMVQLLESLKKEYSDNVEAVERYAPAVTSAHPEAMADFLAGIREQHGGFDDLAGSLEITDEVAALRRELLEAPSEQTSASTS